MQVSSITQMQNFDFIESHKEDNQASAMEVTFLSHYIFLLKLIS